MNIFRPGAYIEPLEEAAAYEALWCSIKDPSFKQVAEKLQRQHPSKLKQFIPPSSLDQVRGALKKIDFTTINILVKATHSYPRRLLDLESELPILYYQGNLDLLEMPAVSVVGARAASERGLETATRIAKSLVKDGFAVISGLAEGIDTAAHNGAIEGGGETVAVIGTPLDESYPKKNRELQTLIAKRFLLISQVPFLRYKAQSWKLNRFFFPERNKTMAALTRATIIVEASDKSGTLTQARECLRMKRKLILLKPTVDNESLTWPKNYMKREGTFVAEKYSDIQKILQSG